MTLKYSLTKGFSPESPLVVLVHGKAGHLTIMSIFARYIPEGTAILFVEAPYPDPIGGYSWWLEGNAPKESAKFLYEELQSIFLNENIRPEVITGVGFSQGGAILSLIVQRDPTFFSK